MHRALTLVLLLPSLACGSDEPTVVTPASQAPVAEAIATAQGALPEAQGIRGPEEAPGEAAAADPSDEAEDSFGEPLSDAELVALADIATNPERFAGKRVKTEGEITQVCQRMGCWMEMRSEGAPPIRVPMAGHSFFLPKDAAGRRCTIEGEVALRELSEAEREHLASEGAQVLASALQINATGVVLR